MRVLRPYLLFAVMTVAFTIGSSAFAAAGWVTARSGLNFRVGPNGKRIKVLRYHTKVQIYGRYGNWYLAQLSDGWWGYIYSRYVSTDFKSATSPHADSGYCSNCHHQTATQKALNQVRKATAKTSYVGGRYAPIMSPFLQNLQRCAPGCSYTSWGVWGDVYHQHEHSCHNSGSAIDIHAICGGRIQAGSARFMQFVSCMRANRSLYVIYGHGEHKSHAHISLRSCEIGHSGKIQTKPGRWRRR